MGDDPVMADYEIGREILERLAQEFERDSESAGRRNRNEASTRFHIIDALLNDVLGWPKATTRVEKHQDRGFSDYELGDPPALLVEAKREGMHFSLPVGWTNPKAKLETLFSSAPDVKGAVGQAIQYCHERGIPFGAICNGHQLIAFVASRQDGVPPLKGTALVFLSLEDMFTRFIELWDTLSPPGILAGNLARALAAELLPPPPEKLSARILDYPGFKNRNPIATELQILGGLFLEDIARAPELEEEFLAETYCKSGALSQHALVSKELLRARYKTTFEKESEISASPAVGKKGVSPELTRDILAASLSRRPILLVGDLGVGKSMFIRHLIKVDAKEELARALVLYIDFGSKPALLSDLRPYIISEIQRQLDEKYSIDVGQRDFVRGVYHGKLQKFATSIYADLKESDPKAFRAKEVEYLEKLTSDPEEHLRSCLSHAAKGQQRQVVLFLDNVDQRPPKFQEEVFLVAQAFAENWPVTAFVSLRPETFAQSRAAGSLSAYQPRVFTIEPPRVDLVLRQRLLFAKKRLEEQGRLPWMTQGLTVQSGNLLRYMEMLLRAFETQQDIVEFIDNMSAGNIRRALDFIGAFVGSGHVDSRKILDAIEKTGGYVLPLHEFLRAVTYGDAEHYAPSKSQLINVYDISAKDGKEHFLVALIVSFVERAGQVGGSEGYVTREEIHRFGQELGFHAPQITIALERSLEKYLLATPSALQGEKRTKFRVTAVGAYTAKKLMFLFAYVDAIVVDTPIVDPSFRSELDECHAIRERVERASRFIDYLEQQWSKVGQAASEIFDWAAGAERTRKEIDKIRGRLDSTPGKLK